MTSNNQHPDGTWASDGSTIPADQLRGIPSTTASLVGHDTAAYKLVGQATSSGQGELIGFIAALLAAQRANLDTQTIYTDYLATVRAHTEIQQPGFQVGSWADRKHGELYRWIAHIVKTTPTTPRVEHIKAHTELQDDISKLNDAADKAAKAVHRHFPGNSLATVGPMTAFMPKFAVMHRTQGYVNDTWKEILADSLATAQFKSCKPEMRERLSHINEPSPTPDYYYTRSPKSYLVKVQYIARGGFLISDLQAWRKGTQASPKCSLCNAVGDHNHIFLECPALEKLRKSAVKEAASTYRVRRNTQAAPISDEQRSARRLAWHQYVEKIARTEGYWTGCIPKPSDPLIPWDEEPAHQFAISLASRVYAQYLHKRKIVRGKEQDDPVRRTAPPDPQVSLISAGADITLLDDCTSDLPYELEHFDEMDDCLDSDQDEFVNAEIPDRLSPVQIRDFGHDLALYDPLEYERTHQPIKSQPLKRAGRRKKPAAANKQPRNTAGKRKRGSGGDEDAEIGSGREKKRKGKEKGNDGNGKGKDKEKERQEDDNQETYGQEHTDQETGDQEGDDQMEL